MCKDHSQVPVAGAGGLREHFWVPANAGNSARVFCRSGWDVAEHARGCWDFDPLELHSSPSPSGRKELNTLGDLLKTILVV